MATAKTAKAAKGKQLLALVALALLVVGMAPQQLEASRHLPGVDVELAVIGLQDIDTPDDHKSLTVDATSIHFQPSLLATALDDLPFFSALSASTSTNRRFRLLEPLAVGAWGENLTSGGFQPLSERISLTENAFRWESRIADHFVQPDPLGYVDSHNLFQGLGYSGLNVLDPMGEAGIVKAKVGPGDWFETVDRETGNALLDYTVVGMYNEIRNGCALACNMGANVLWIFDSVERTAANWLIDKGLIDEIDLAFLESMAAGAYPTIAAQKARIEITQTLVRLKGIEGQARIRRGLKRLLDRIVDWERRRRVEDPNYWQRGSVRVGEAPRIVGNDSWVVQPGQASHVHPGLPVRQHPRDPTRGLLDVGGDELVPLRSGRKGPGDSVDVAGLSREAKIALTHVEGHAAAAMRANNIQSASLHINYVTGPCRFCRGEAISTGVQELLLPGQRLDVTFPLPNGNIGRGYFVGGPDGGFVSLLPDF